jgi:hypothetical protein
MAAQQDIAVTPRLLGPPHPVAQGPSASSIVADESRRHNDWAKPEDTLMERFLYNLRAALSVPHT